MIIDWQHHFSTPELYPGKSGEPVYEGGKVAAHVRQEIYQVEKHLEFMDAAGIDMAVLSFIGAHNVEECKLLHDNCANIFREHPKRFAGLALCIPTLGSEALDELDRAITVIGLKGVMISPQIQGNPLDSDKLWPFYEMVSRLKVPIFVHITRTPIGYDAFDAPYNLNVTLTRECDIANALVRTILGGVLTKFPDLKFVFAHMGGGISATLERMVRYIDTWGEKFWTEQGGRPPFGEPFGENFEKCFDKIYFDMAGFEGGMNSVKCALTTISPEKLVFATDYPYNFTYDPQGVKDYIGNIRKLDLPSKSIEAMLGGNAVQLLGI